MSRSFVTHKETGHDNNKHIQYPKFPLCDNNMSLVCFLKNLGIGM